MAILLYDWGPSPFCFKVRAILDYKGIAYKRLNVLSRIREVKRRGQVGKTPALDIDGELIVDSTNIAYTLEERFPDPPVIPADAHARAQCHVLEDWADEALYFIGLYYQWLEPSGARLVPLAFGKSLTGRLVYRVMRRRIRRQVDGQGTGRKPEALIRADLARELDAVEAYLEGRPFLLGDTPYLCDFALAGQLVYMTRPPVTAEALSGRPAIGAYLERIRALRGDGQQAA